MRTGSFFTPSTLGFVRTAVVSPELRVADVAFNTQAIGVALRNAAAQGCRLAVFPELSITGYSCADLLYQSALLEAARAALEDDDYVERTQRMVREGLAQLERGFEELGLEYVPSVANFILVKVGRGREAFVELQKRKVIVRPMDGYGLPDHVRVTVGLKKENEHFLKALKHHLAERGAA